MACGGISETSTQTSLKPSTICSRRFGRELPAADEHLVELAPARHLAELGEVAEHRQVGDRREPRSVIGNADESKMREIEGIRATGGSEATDSRIGAVKGDPLLDLSVFGKPGDEPIENWARHGQAKDDGEQEKSETPRE